MKNILRKSMFALAILLASGTGLSLQAEEPVVSAVAPQNNSSDYYIYGLDEIYNQIGRRYTIIGDKPENARVEWEIDGLSLVTMGGIASQYVVVTRGNATGTQIIRAHLTGKGVNVVLEKHVFAVDGKDPNPNDTGYIRDWW